MTIEEFRRIYEDWQTSGLSVQQFCKDRGILESRFYYWKAKLKGPSQPSSCGSFIPVRMSRKSGVSLTGPASDGGALCEIVYPNGVTVRVTSDMTLDQFRQMITLLR